MSYVQNGGWRYSTFFLKKHILNELKSVTTTTTTMMMMIPIIRSSSISLVIFLSSTCRSYRCLCNCNISSNNGLSQLTRKPTSTNTKTGSYLPFCNSQITLNGRQGNLHGAQSIFDQMPLRDVVSWTALLTAYAQNGCISKARHLFDQMPQRNTAAWNAMVSAYVRGSNISEAFRLFSGIPHKNLVSYSAILSGFTKNGIMSEAVKVYIEMPSEWRDPVGSNALINGYLRIGQLHEAERVFGMMSVRDVVSWSSMVDGYCKCGRFFQAMEIFDSMPERNVVSWTCIIRGLLESGSWDHAFELFSQMRREGTTKPNSTTFSILFDACAKLGRSRGIEGLQLHGLVVLLGFEHDVFLGNSIIVMYCKGGWIDDARRWFDAMSRKDAVSWNSIIQGYVEHDEIEKAYTLFNAMPGKDPVSWTSMLVGFSNRGLTRESVLLFEAMPQRDDVAWTAIISCFVANGENIIACEWFHRMMQEGMKPNPMVLCCVLSALARLSILKQGVQIHALVIKLNLELDVSIQTSLISMYTKCGDLGNSYCIFSGITEPNTIAFNAMLTGFTQHGLAREAIELFKRMETNSYCKPNHVTFLEILSACSHAGLVEEGYTYFENMSSCYGVEPGPDHYTCMVDLFGRAGLLHEAHSLIISMPFRPNSSVWGALLSASKLHSNVKLARLAADRLFQLEPDNAATYAVLSSLYAEAGMKEDEEEVQRVKKSNSVKKNPGCSWILQEQSGCQFIGA